MEWFISSLYVACLNNTRNPVLFTGQIGTTMV